MRKLLLVVAIIGSMFLTASPAQAALGRNCHTYTNNPGTRKIEMCVSIKQGTDSQSHPTYRALVEFNTVAGYNEPYRVYSVDALNWSSPDGVQSPWCDGYYSACSGGGDVSGKNSTSFPVDWDTGASNQFSHYGYVLGEGQANIEWTNGGTVESHDFDSDPVYTYPWCVDAPGWGGCNN